MAPKYNRTASFEDRLISFTDFPPTVAQTRESLAHAGFRYTSVRDKVRCDYCGGKLYNWRPADDPVVQHIRYFPKCEFLKRLLESEEKEGDDKKGKEEEKEVKREERRNGGAKRWGADEEWLRDQMERPMTQIVISRGHSEEDVKRVITERYEDTGQEFGDAANLLNAIFDLQDKIDQEKGLHGDQGERAETKDAAGSHGLPMASADAASEAYSQRQAAEPQKRGGKGRCLVCEEKEQGAMFLPCGHLAVCPECAMKMEECVVCNKHVQNRLRVYLG